MSRNMAGNSVTEDLENLEIQVEKEIEKKRNSITFEETADEVIIEEPE